MNGAYRQKGDYLLPNLVPPESIPIGIWANGGVGISVNTAIPYAQLYFSATNWMFTLSKSTSKRRKSFLSL